jgi:hypothetical protein
MKYRWTPSLEVCAQTCHVLGGLCFAGWSAAFGWPSWMPWAVTGGWALIKEYGFDLIVERDSFLSSTFDASMYLVGCGAGVLLRWLTLGS